MIRSGGIPIFSHRRTASSSSPRPSSDRKSTRLNSSHSQISYAVFCLKKKKELRQPLANPFEPFDLRRARKQPVTHQSENHWVTYRNCPLRIRNLYRNHSRITGSM